MTEHMEPFVREVDVIMGRDVSKEVYGAGTKSGRGRLEAMRDIRVEMGDGLCFVFRYRLDS